MALKKLTPREAYWENNWKASMRTTKARAVEIAI
jgi:hypothetical protein